MGSRMLSSAALLLLASAVRVRSAVPVPVPFLTELDIFSQLAPCVTAAVTNAYLWEQDTTACGSEPTKLQSCICTNAAERDKMTASIRSAVSSRCGSTADDDQTSAAALVDKYCHPDRTVTFATPTTNVIPGVMSDVAAISSLPPCVQSGLSAAVTAAAYDGCPTVANMWAPCVCSKKNIVDQISSSLGPQVRSSCSNADDVTLASSFYTEFCAMNQGTTSFGAMPGPPGDMTYYITALPQFSSLHACAQSGVIQAVMSQSSYLCASGPQALASCICLKPGILGKASQTLTSSVKYACDNTALADVASAAAVLDYYCQAAQNKVVATVSQSISETKATTLGQATRPTSGSGNSAPENTSAAGGGAGTRSGGGGGLGKGAIIAIAVLGALVFIGLIALVAIVVRRRNRKAAAAAAAAAAADAGQQQQPPHPEQSELATNSPSSEMDGKSPYAPPSISEVAATPSPYRPHAELSAPAQMHQAVSPSELSSPGSQPGYGPNSPYNPNQHWAPPPGQVLYELDSSSPGPHAR